MSVENHADFRAAVARITSSLARLGDWYEEKPWHIVCVQPMHEATFAAHMVARGWPAYVPMEKVQFQRLGRPQFKFAPMFRGYVFAHLLDVDHQVAVLRGLGGFSRMLTTGDRFAPYATVPAFLIDAFTMQEFGLSTKKKWQRYAGVSAGQKASPTTGPFAGVWGEVLKVEPDKRITLLLDLFGRPTPVTLESDEIETA